MKTWRMAGLALATLAASCSGPAEPFVIPGVQDVSYLSATQLEGTSTVLEHEIRDPGRIALVREPDPKGRVVIENGRYR